jgi:hypothetical protein
MYVIPQGWAEVMSRSLAHGNGVGMSKRDAAVITFVWLLFVVVTLSIFVVVTLSIFVFGPLALRVYDRPRPKMLACEVS